MDLVKLYGDTRVAMAAIFNEDNFGPVQLSEPDEGLSLKERKFIMVEQQKKIKLGLIGSKKRLSQ